MFHLNDAPLNPNASLGLMEGDVGESLFRDDTCSETSSSSRKSEIRLKALPDCLRLSQLDGA